MIFFFLKLQGCTNPKYKSVIHFKTRVIMVPHSVGYRFKFGKKIEGYYWIGTLAS